jgi:hypothetical protein
MPGEPKGMPGCRGSLKGMPGCRGNLKPRTSKKFEVRPNNTVLCYNDGYLELDATLEDYDIPNGATLVYHVRLCGPLPVDTDWSLAGFTKLQKVGRKRGI